MVSIRIDGSSVTMVLEGLHRWWSLRREVRFDKANIVSVKRADEALRRPLWRWPGTHVPWVIAAGTYRGKGRREFWDTTFKGQAIQIDLDGEEFTRLVVDVEEPERAIAALGSRGQ